MEVHIMLTNEQLLSCATDLVPADLVADVERSLVVPQVGPYHQEGPFMDSHLVRVLATLEDIADGQIDERVPETVRSLMVKAVESVGLDTCRLYVLLHDADKATCLTLVFTDGSKRAITWGEWTAMFTGTTGDELSSFCQESGIEQISYYQDQDGVKRTHGRVTAERLRGRGDIPEIVVSAIEEHELAFTFGTRGGTNIPLIERMVEGKDDICVGFTFAVNYADQMGSYREDGRPDMGYFLLMTESFVAFRQLAELTARIVKTDRLHKQKVEKVVADLRRSTDAFRAETADQAYSRIVGDAKLPEVTEAQVRTALEQAIAEGLPREIIDTIVVEMTSSGKLSSETGKALGRFNRPVRAALATLG